jgi:initiation factor 1A
MVKNFGGNKSKGFARKGFAKKDNSLRVSQESDEIYAQVTKIFGGTMCQVTTLDGTQMLCHIRGKFRGRGKRDNFISNGSWLLVGKRDWEKECLNGKLMNCDVIEVYNDADKFKIKNTVTNVNWTLFINNDSKLFGCEDSENSSGFVFTDNKTEEYQELLESQVNGSLKTGISSIITTDDGDIIDVDDI